jgi:hypothetical protein
MEKLLDIDISSGDTSWPLDKKADFKKLSKVARLVIEKKLDITNGLEEDWRLLAKCFAIYGEYARSLFHDISFQNEFYSHADTNAVFDDAVKKTKFKTPGKFYSILNLLGHPWKDWLKERDKGDVIIEDDYEFPEGVDKELAYRNGWYAYINKNEPLKSGYYFQENKKFDLKSNFVMTPLYHKEDEDENSRIFEIENGFEKQTLEVPSKVVISLDQFNGLVVEKGNFIWLGTKLHFMRVMAPMLQLFEKCYEMKTLGWQPEGFFAYSNVVFSNGEIEEYNDYGIVKHKDKLFLSPSASNSLKGLRNGSELYQNDMFLKYKKPKITFSQWCKQMIAAYEDAAYYGIAFAIGTLFLDVVRSTVKFPLLYPNGSVGSGKSEFAESINNLFFGGKDSSGKLYKPMNLNQGTDYAFYNRMERFFNAPNTLNEYDEYMVAENWVRSIKASFDGEGRTKGTGKKNKSKEQAINCSIIIVGQFLTTKDDASTLSRTVPIPFKLKDVIEREKTAEAWRTLKKWEEQNISGCLTDLLLHRDFFEKKYREKYLELQKELLEEFNEKKYNPHARFFNNILALLTSVYVFEEKIDFGFKLSDFKKMCKQKIVELTSLIMDSNALSDFWKTVDFMLERGMIEDGNEFKIKYVQNVQKSVAGNETQLIEFASTKKVLFIRLESLHTLYQEVKNKTKMKPLNLQTVKSFLVEQKYYIGQNPKSHFTIKGKGSSTSSLMFDYDMIGLNLERMEVTPEPMIPIEISGKVTSVPSLEKQGDIKYIKFDLVQSVDVKTDGRLMEEKTKYRVFMESGKGWNAPYEGDYLNITGEMNKWSFSKGNNTIEMRDVYVTAMTNQADIGLNNTENNLFEEKKNENNIKDDAF